MIIKPLTSRWLRRVRRLALAWASVPVTAGLAFTWWAAVQGQVLQAAVAASATLVVLGVAFLASAWLRVAAATLRTGRRLDRIEHRLSAAMEFQFALHSGPSASSLERHRQQIEHKAERLNAAMEAIDARRRELEHRLSEAQATVENACSQYEEQADRFEQDFSPSQRSPADVRDEVSLADSHWADDDTPPGERTLTAFKHLIEQKGDGKRSAAAQTRADKLRLSQEFASLIHRRSYAEALSKGDEIVNRYPDSTIASDFRRVRPHLVRKIQSQQVRQRQR